MGHCQQQQQQQQQQRKKYTEGSTINFTFSNIYEASKGKLALSEYWLLAAKVHFVHWRLKGDSAELQKAQ